MGLYIGVRVKLKCGFFRKLNVAWTPQLVGNATDREAWVRGFLYNRYRVTSHKIEIEDTRLTSASHNIVIKANHKSQNHRS
jgi:hypothetical protein